MSRRRNNGEEEERMEADAAVENGADLPERWSARRKSELVLRLLKGEDIGSVSRETQVPVHELETWRRIFLEGGTTGLRRHGTCCRQPTVLQSAIGEPVSPSDEETLHNDRNHVAGARVRLDAKFVMLT